MRPFTFLLRLILLAASLLVCPDVWTVAAQELPSTAYTRTLLRSPDQATAQAVLGLGTNPPTVTLATFQQVVVSNNWRFATNAFPLVSGTTWDVSRYHQLLLTNADFNVTALAGVSNRLGTVAELVISNSAASTIIGHLQFAGNKIGPNTTNDLYIPSGKEAYVTVETRAFQRTNYVTAVEQ